MAVKDRGLLDVCVWFADQIVKGVTVSNTKLPTATRRHEPEQGAPYTETENAAMQPRHETEQVAKHTETENPVLQPRRAICGKT